MHSTDWSWGQGMPSAVQQGQLPVSPPFGTWHHTHAFSNLGHIPSPQQEIPPSHKPLAVAGRKRSRQEMSDALDDDSSGSSPPAHPLASSHASTPMGEPIFGPGMTLVYPDDPAYSAMVGANSQTGTWAEELAERMRSNSLEEYSGAKRLNLDSRKSMKLDRDAARPDDVTASIHAEGHVRAPSAPDDHIIDEATHALGIGWNVLPSNPIMDAACRGWARYIENNFPLQSVKVVWKNKSLPAFLVSAATRESSGFSGSPGYYLFNEDLSQGKLVAKSWGRTLDNLRCAPMAFDGVEVLDLEPGMPMDGMSMSGPAPVLVSGGMDID